MALRLIGVDDIGITNINDPHIARQIGDIIFMVIRPGMTKRKQRGRFADASRAEARATAVLRAHIQRRAHHGNIGINLCPIGADRALAKAANPGEWQIKAACIIGVHRLLRQVQGFDLKEIF